MLERIPPQFRELQEITMQTDTRDDSGPSRHFAVGEERMAMQVHRGRFIPAQNPLTQPFLIALRGQRVWIAV